jgi:hypothetical protein
MALYFAGAIVEPALGASWFLIVFLVSALGGSITSVIFHSENYLSVGASGGIMGLLVLALLISFRLSSSDSRKAEALNRIPRILIPALIPIANKYSHIDFAGHFGGVIAGGVVGWILLKYISELKTQKLGRNLALFSFLILSFAGFSTVQNYQKFVLFNELVPEEKMPKRISENIEKFLELLKEYPNDPRLLLLQSSVYFDQKKFYESEMVLKKMLLNPKLILMTNPILREIGGADLVSVLKEQGKLQEARGVATLICGTESAKKISKILNELKVCQ